jgi:hypothetical protein
MEKMKTRFTAHFQVEDFVTTEGRQALRNLVRHGALDPHSDRMAREWLDVDSEVLTMQRWRTVSFVCALLVGMALVAAPFL